MSFCPLGTVYNPNLKRCAYQRTGQFPKQQTSSKEPTTSARTESLGRSLIRQAKQFQFNIAEGEIGQGINRIIAQDRKNINKAKSKAEALGKERISELHTMARNSGLESEFMISPEMAPDGLQRDRLLARLYRYHDEDIEKRLMIGSRGERKRARERVEEIKKEFPLITFANNYERLRFFANMPATKIISQIPVIGAIPKAFMTTSNIILESEDRAKKTGKRTITLDQLQRTARAGAELGTSLVDPLGEASGTGARVKKIAKQAKAFKKIGKIQFI
jgi:hypothetical protein